MPPPAHIVAVAALLALPAAAGAQTLAGRVLEDGRNTPVSGVEVSLVDHDGKHRAEATSDSLGRFVLVPPRAGEYVLEAERLGYEPTRSPLLAIKSEGTVAIDLMMTPEPIGLEGLEVSVEKEAEELLRSYGHGPADLGRRWISREALEGMPQTVGPVEAIRWQSVPGVWVYSHVPGTTDSDVYKDLCVTFQRGRTFGGQDRCAVVLVDGAVTSSKEAAQLNRDEIEAMAILTPVDASTFYGTSGGGGIVLIWTRRGGG